MHIKPQTLLFLLALCVAGMPKLAKSQGYISFAMINDPDGYTNIREAADGKSKIVGQIFEHEIFTYEEEEGNWIKVRVGEDPLGLCSSAYLTGYIHRSRLVPLENLPRLNESTFEVNLKESPFDPSKHHLKKKGVQGLIEIDGQDIWGTDGTMPTRKTDVLSFSISGKVITVPPLLFRNLYQMWPEAKAYQHNDYYLILQDHSDGAGGYSVIWVIHEVEVVGRNIFLGY